MGLKEGEWLVKKYRDELSGGMGQRVMIGMAMVCHRKVMMGDEGTTGVDVRIQAEMVGVVKKVN
ncbi:ATP-binding cassette domain-containing protein, partial [Bacillus pumilus]|uniref:ATP-binding cassette domain-containing protein n=1 Tax=Bacillus pumilus TaxID=1408 RepID=UPI0021B4D463